MKRRVKKKNCDFWIFKVKKVYSTAKQKKEPQLARKGSILAATEFLSNDYFF